MLDHMMHNKEMKRTLVRSADYRDKLLSKIAASARGRAEALAMDFLVWTVLRIWAAPTGGMREDQHRRKNFTPSTEKEVATEEQLTCSRIYFNMWGNHVFEDA